MAVSRSLRFQILRRDNHACTYCGRTAPEVKLTVDHVVPEALGGSDDPSNLTTACAECNGGKSATPADASKVAAVAADAQRWAAAQALVASRMLAERNQRTAVHDQFDEAWRQWGGLFRPSTWTQSVDAFLSAGLPIEVLLDCVEQAAGSRKIKAPDVFRYMCGIAWSRVRVMREQVEELAGRSSSQDANADPYARVLSLESWEKDRLEVPAYEEGELDMAREVLEAFSEEDLQRFVELGRERAKSLEEEAPGHNVEGFEMRHAAVAALTETYEKAWVLDGSIRYLLSAVPEDIRAELTADAKAEIESHMGEPASDFHVMWWSVHLIADRLRKRYGTPEPGPSPAHLESTELPAPADPQF